MLGMTLALRLRQRGHEVTLLEGAPSLGGLAAAWQLGDITWDKHYHVILYSDLYLRHLLDELGLTDQLRWSGTKTGVFADGKLYSVSNAVEFLRFPALGLVDKARLAWTILLGSRLRDWRALEHVTVEQWLTKHSGRRTFDRFWKPLLRSKLGDNYEIASAAFIWATIQRLYAARRSGLGEEQFGYVVGGYRTILDRLGERLTDRGVDIRLGMRAQRVARAEDGRIVVEIEGREPFRFDRVVATPASPIAAELVAGLANDERSLLADVTYQGIVCASVLLERSLGPYYVTNITDDGFPFTGVIEMSALVDRDQFGGSGLVYLPKYTTPGDEILSWTDERVEKEFLAGLARMYPDFDPDDVRAFQISRVRYVMPLSTLDYSTRVSSFETSVPGVYAVNSSQILNGTLNVNETIQLAERAVPVLVGDVPDAIGALEAAVPPGGGTAG